MSKSQAQRIQEIGLGRWLDEPMNLDEFYGKPTHLRARLVVAMALAFSRVPASYRARTERLPPAVTAPPRRIRFERWTTGHDVWHWRYRLGEHVQEHWAWMRPPVRPLDRQVVAANLRWMRVRVRYAAGRGLPPNWPWGSSRGRRRATALEK